MSTKRIYYLGWLRVSVFWLLILFHSWQPYTSFDWLINAPESSIIADVLSVFFHTWRLHLIFFISGVGTWLVLRKQNATFYILDKDGKIVFSNTGYNPDDLANWIKIIKAQIGKP